MTGNLWYDQSVKTNKKEHIAMHKRPMRPICLWVPESATHIDWQ